MESATDTDNGCSAAFRSLPEVAHPMPLKTRFLIAVVLLWAGMATAWAAHSPASSWLHFVVLLAGVLLSSRLKVALPRGEGSMSLNFPFLLLAILQLSPLQAVLLAAFSVAAQCRVRVKKLFTAVQIVFNIASSICATATACMAYAALTKRGMGLAPAISLASACFFFCSTVPVALAIASSKGESGYQLWKREFPWYLPFYLVGAALAAAADRLGAAYGSSTSLLLIPLVYTMYRAYTAQIVRAREREQHLQDTEALHLRTIEGLAMAIEAKDQETHEHLFRVRSYVAAVGAALKLDTLQMKALHTAAFLHDIGKLAVPEHIINKPGKLTLEEFEKMKIHPVVGADILDRVQFPYPVVPIVRSHHEWWNGQGYPDGLKGEEIPIGARILTVVDCFDALTSDRPYRKGKTLAEAMEMLNSLSGSQFDPHIVNVFQTHCLELEKQTRKDEDRHFVPLVKEVNVWRGIAPGAGFEEDNAVVSSREGGFSSCESSNADTGAASLQLIAAARQEAQILFEMSQSLGNSLSLQETISVMASRLHRLIPFDCCALYLVKDDAVVLQHVDGEDARCFSSQPIPMGEGISGWVAESGKAILNGNAAVEASYHRKATQQEGLRAALAMPLNNLANQVFGVLTLYAVQADSFSRDHLRILQVMESKLSLSLQNVGRFRQAESDADIDFLTNLPNARKLFLQLETELNRCRRSESSLSLVMCDLNSFKQVNDREGHVVGDRLLSAVAEQFRQGCRAYDTVARIGGDEFVFLFPDTTGIDLSARLASITEMVLSARRSVGVTSEVSASLGSCSFPADGNTAEDLLALADRRMYSNKEAHHRATSARKDEPHPKASV